MKKIKKCDIIQDLSLSYIDEILSESSKNFVEEHLKTCKECQNKINNMKKDIKNIEIEDEQKEIDYLKNIKKKMSTKNKISIITGIALITIIILNIIVFTNYNKTANKIKIYLRDDITKEQLENIKQEIIKQDKTAKITYHSKQDEFERLKQKLKENKNLIDTRDKIFPALYEVESKLDTVKNIEEKIISMDGVEKIQSYINENPYVMFFMKIE